MPITIAVELVEIPPVAEPPVPAAPATPILYHTVTPALKALVSAYAPPPPANAL